MRIGFAGVAHSHPFSDARNARTLGAAELAVWDPDDHSRRADFVRQWQATTYESLAALLDREPDVVIVTPRPHRIAAVVSAVLDRGIACFLNKVPAADPAGLAALDAAVGDRSGRFLTSSVLRFAPGIRALAAELAGAAPIAAHISVRHGIDAFTTTARRWQDDPAEGGGTAVSMGLHAWEMLDTVLGREVTPLGGVTSRIAGSATISENVVAVHAVAAGGIRV
ncbi:MAG: Gfo/Idh/MocA family oxidoreductase, partial [Nocardia sp.]|nr:Gfo/Idh/MocA family oxidoreductase [Nocardia sp.]